MFQRREKANSVQVEFKLAEIWQKRGQTERAAEGFQRVLRAEPDHELAQLHLADIFAEQNRLPEAIRIYAHALARHPNQPRLHKGMASALTAQGGFDAAFAYYGLERADSRPLDLQPDDILCCVVVHNEALRLPFFFEYYRAQGVARFFVVDNNSTDGSLDLMRAQPDVYVWRSALPFKRVNFGAAWFELLLRRYGVEHWWVMVDADELLAFPAYETRTLVQFCHMLERQGKRSFNAVLLDMYSDKPIRDTLYVPGEDFRRVCPYFDRAFYNDQVPDAGPFRNQVGFRGGARERVFGGGSFYLSKVPLLKYDAGVLLAGGQHWTNHPVEVVAGGRGALLHFKFFSIFASQVAQEVARKQHVRDAYEYRAYARQLNRNHALSMYHPAVSVKYESSAQLVELGVMRAVPETIARSVP